MAQYLEDWLEGEVAELSKLEVGELSNTLPIIGANEAMPKKKKIQNKAIQADNILKKLPARRINIF